MSEADTQRILSDEGDEGSAFSITVGHLMFHVANHSMQHRTEIATSLTRHGHSPGALDYLFYVLEENEKLKT
jgi:uncharacterized damage-inducible protein DinB